MKRTSLNRKTPLKRGTSELKRTPLKRGKPLRKQSKKGRAASPANDAGEALRERYRAAYDICEYCGIINATLPVHGRFGCSAIVRIDEYDERLLDLEHIFQAKSGGRGKPEYWSNYARCCRASHEWKGRYPVEGVIAALAMKWRKESLRDAAIGLPCEFGILELNAACGRDVLGWLSVKLENHSFRWPEFRRLGLELLEATC